MARLNQPIRFRASREVAICLSAIALLLGLALVLLGQVLRSLAYVPNLLTTLGVALVVSVSTSLIHRQITYVRQFQEMQEETELRLHVLLSERFDILDAIRRAGIRRIYPKWSSFCENILPDHLPDIESNFVAIGIGLSVLAQLSVSGRLRHAIEEKLRAGKAFVFCIVDPYSAAVSQREAELGVQGSTSSAINASLAYLLDFKRQMPGCPLTIKVLRRHLPKAAMIMIDDRVAFYSPYLSSERMPSSWVIESEPGQELFQKIRKDINHLLKDSTDWTPGRDEAAR